MGMAFRINKFPEEFFEFLNQKRTLGVCRQASEKLPFGFEIYNVGRIGMTAQLQLYETTD